MREKKTSCAATKGRKGGLARHLMMEGLRTQELRLGVGPPIFLGVWAFVR